METYCWNGISGNSFKHEVYEIGDELPDIPANYCVAKRKEGTWVPIYFGHTKNVKSRIPNHHKLDCFKFYHSSHVHVHPNDPKKKRKTVERDLLRNEEPVCNKKGFWEMLSYHLKKKGWT